MKCLLFYLILDNTGGIFYCNKDFIVFTTDGLEQMEILLITMRSSTLFFFT